MSQLPQSPPLALVDERAPPTGHIAQFYEDESFLCDTAAQFISAGLAAGDSALVIATAPHRALFRRGLGRHGCDVERAIDCGRLALVDAHATLRQIASDGLVDHDRFIAVVGAAVEQARARSGSGRVRAFGEMVDLLWRDGHPHAALHLEELWNELAQRCQLTLLCGYLLGNFYKETDAEPFHSVCLAHTRVLPTETFARIAEEDARLRQIGVLQQRALALETEVKRRRELERALRDALAEREAASRAKDEFLAMLGHELRNPLAPIVTALQLMKLKGDVRCEREQEIIERQVDHLVRLVDDLLDVSRITRGKVDLKRETVDLSSVVAKAVEIARPLLEQRQHHFSVSVPRASMRIDADATRMSQVIANLLTNAAKYTESGGTITVRAWRDGHEVVLSVRDSGIGIDVEMLPKVFDLFVQGPRASDRALGGLGIGLTLVKSLVQLHGGSVSAVSDGAGRGSEFVVRLPAAAKQEGADEPSTATDARIRRAQKPRRILVIDDNVDAAVLLAEVLRAAGHEVTVAHDGPQALHALVGFSPEVAIVDIGLPVMDGYELAERLREALSGKQPRLIAATGYGQEHDRVLSARAGFDAHLVKPINPERLLRCIDEA
jgi:signal transduction histidine kinase